jgi:hypothetical protein
MWYEQESFKNNFLFFNQSIELLLQPNNGVSTCTGNGPPNANTSCSRLFGDGAIFCQTGLCRCNPGFAFNKEDNTGCCKYT